MDKPPRKRPERTGTYHKAVRLALGVLSSVALVIATIYYGVPALLRVIPYPALAVLAVILLVPGVPVLSLVLQKRLPASLRVLLAHYLWELLHLAFELLFIALVLPLVLLDLYKTVGAGLLVAMLIRCALYLVQEGFGVDMGINLSRRDMGVYLRALVGLALAELVVYRLHSIAERKEESVFELFRVPQRRLPQNQATSRILNWRMRKAR